MSDKPSEADRLSDIYQHAMREHVPTGIDCAFGDIIEGQHKAMAQTAAEFSRPYRERIAELEAQLRSALNLANKRSAELESKVVKLEAECAALREAAKEPTVEDYQRVCAKASSADRRIKIGQDHIHELGSCSHCDKPKACPGCGAVEPAYHQIGCRMMQPCTCPATSE